MKIQHHQDKSALAEINIVPLVDIMLVLLIIFMVISPLLVQSELKVNLPKVTTAAKAEDTAVKIEIGAQGEIVLQGEKVSRRDLKKMLQAQFPEGHQNALLINADKNVAFQDVVFVMDLAKQLKVQKLGVAVIPEFGQ